MRLSQIKIVGFKSFVEPTKLQLAHALTAIVGPNGCGKSNSLDAVRWVMGESSARELRGGEMNDVLFSGSDQRAPVSQCSVELLFDNPAMAESADQANRLAGPFGQLTEISVKRVHHREEGTRYYLNNQPCRRRDVLDLFNGTGLGPRSYALIGQGSISRIIEAKPEDLRHYIEEVAGIAGYRQRRKETLARLNKAQDNLNQLSLLQEELQHQHQHLVRQAEQAQTFQNIQSQVKTLTWQVYQTKWHQILTKLADLGDQLRAQQARFSDTKQSWDAAQIAWITAKQQRQATQQAWQAQTQVYHQLDKELSRLQQQQAFAKQQEQQQQQLVKHLNQQQQQAESALIELSQTETHLRAKLDELNLEQDSVMELLEELTERINAIESQQSHYLVVKTQAETRYQRLNQQCQQAESTKQGLWRQIEQAKQQQAWLSETLHTEAAATPNNTELANLANGEQETIDHLALLRQRILDAEQEQVHLALAVKQALADQQQCQQLLQRAQQAWQTQQAHYNALHGLQQSWRDKAQSQLTDQSTPSDQPDQLALVTPHQWLIESLQVDSAWRAAVTAWLGPRIDGLVFDRLPVELIDAAELPQTTLPFMLWPLTTEAFVARSGSLAEVIHAPFALRTLANNLLRRDPNLSLQHQLAQLAVDQAIIDQAGRLFFPYAWQAPYAGKAESEGAIYLARADELAALEQQLPRLEQSKEAAQQALSQQDAKLQRQQQAWQTLQAQLPVWIEQLQTLQQQQAKEQAHQAASVRQQQRYQTQLAQAQQQLDALELEFNQLTAELERRYDELDQAQADLEAPQTAWAQLEQAKLPLRQQQQRLEQHYSQHQAQHLVNQQQLDQLLLQKSHYQQQRLQAEQGLQQWQPNVDPVPAIPAEALAEQAAKLAAMAQQLSELEQAVSQAEQRLEQAELQAQQSQQTHQAAQFQLESLQQQLANQQQQLHQLSEQIQQEGLALPSAHQSPNVQGASLSSLETQLREAKKRLQALGNVNMTAIDERDQLADRLAELVANYQDIEGSISELEQAMAALDQQSRTQLLSCFEQVNQRFAELFPQLFKGGKATLSWLKNQDDPLEDGVAVMAQPPGKRNSRIQLLSGGEKTLTALALIFAIFQLRPAPFCILDEVDAPLDDSNVIRFCGLVRSLSEKVQFIIITHNKTTMAMAQQLLGVSMNEPGVSRLVSVDLAKAVEMIGDEGA